MLFIGLLSKLPEMAQQGIPMVRTGSLGRLNQTDIHVWIDLVRHFKMTVHLLDTRAYRGMSGAPCFIQRLIVRAQPDPHTGEAVTLKTVTYLLGVMSAQFDDKEPVEPLTEENNGTRVRIHSGISVVTPVRFLQVWRVTRWQRHESNAPLRNAANMRMTTQGQPPFPTPRAWVRQPT